MAKKQPKLTPWFPASVKPKRRGWYQRDYLDNSPAYSFWEGSWWSMGVLSLADTMFVKDTPSPKQDLQWRGLAEAPK